MDDGNRLDDGYVTPVFNESPWLEVVDEPPAEPSSDLWKEARPNG